MKFLIILIIMAYTLQSQETIWEIEDADSIKTEIKLSKYKEYFYYQNANNEYVVRKVDDGSIYNKFIIDGELITINEKFDSYYYHNSGTFSKVSFGGERNDFSLNHYNPERPYLVYTNPYIDQAYIFSMDSVYRFDESDLNLTSKLRFKYLEPSNEYYNHLNTSRKELFFQEDNPLILLKPSLEYQKTYQPGWPHLTVEKITGQLFEIHSDKITDQSSKVSNGYVKNKGDEYFHSQQSYYEYWYIRADMFSNYTLNNYISYPNGNREVSVNMTYFFESDNDYYISYYDNKLKSLINLNLSNGFKNRTTKLPNTVLKAEGNISYTYNQRNLFLINIDDANIIESIDLDMINQALYSHDYNFLVSTDSSIKQIKIDDTHFNTTVAIYGPHKATVGDTLFFSSYMKGANNIRWEVDGNKDIGEDIIFVPKEHGLKTIKVYTKVNGNEISSEKVVSIKQAEEPIVTHKIEGDKIMIYHQLVPEDFTAKWWSKDEVISENDTLILPYKNDIFKIRYELNNSINKYNGNYDFIISELETTLDNDIPIDIDGTVSKLMSNDNGLIALISDSNNINLWKENFIFENLNIDLKNKNKITINNFNKLAFIDSNNFLNYLDTDQLISKSQNKISINSPMLSIDSLLIFKESIYNYNGNLINSYDLSDYQGIYENHHIITKTKDGNLYHQHYFYLQGELCYTKPHNEKYLFKIYTMFSHIYDGFEYFDIHNNDVREYFSNTDYSISRFGTKDNLLYHGRESIDLCRSNYGPIYEFPLQYGFVIETNNKVYSKSEIDTIIDYIYPSFYFMYENTVYSKNTENDKITKINLKGDYIAHSVDLYHTWILTRDEDGYYLTDLNPAEKSTTSINELNHDELEVSTNSIILKGKSGSFIISSFDGKTIKKGNFHNVINFDELNPGLYLIKLQTDNGKTYTKKIIRY